MPQKIELEDGANHEVATEEELLEFANKVRAAGGGNALEALLPSRKGMPKSCLIARACNFECAVDCTGHGDGEGWTMQIFGNEKVARSVSEKLGLTLHVEGEGTDWVGHYIELPGTIGAAAMAFDQGLAFKELAERA